MVSLRDLGRNERYGEALILVGLVYLLGAASTDWVGVVSDLLFIGVLLIVVQHRYVSQPLRTASIIAGVVSIVASLARVAAENQLTSITDALSSLIVVVITCYVVLARIIRHPQVTVGTVYGAVLCYILVAFSFASLYEIVEAVTQEPFFAQGLQPTAEFLYFSIMTLTTVGFGDLTPNGDIARRVTAIEAFTGQIYMVVLVARLVSLWRPPTRQLDEEAA